MPTDGGLSVAALSSGLTFTYRSLQTGYEFQGVPQQSKKLLATIDSSKKDIQFAKVLRKTKSRVLNEREKAHVDEKISDTESALDGLEALVEAVRVDLETKFGRVGVWNRMLWILRDSPQVGTSLARVDVAMTALNNMIAIMALRDGDKTADDQYFHYKPNGSTPGPPPTYKTSEFLHQHRVLRNSISGAGMASRPGSEAGSGNGDTEIFPEVSHPPGHLSPAPSVHELDGSHERRPPPAQRATTRNVPHCLRAGPAVAELFGPVEEPTTFRSRAAWLQEHARDTAANRYPSTPQNLGEYRETEGAGRMNRRQQAWEVLNEAPGDQTEQRQSWLAYHASLPR